MYAYTVFIAALTMIAVVSFGYDAMAGSKSHGGFGTISASKKCPKGYIYSEAKRKCTVKPRESASVRVDTAIEPGPGSLGVDQGR